MVDMHQRIAAQAYQALRDALPTIMWHKRAFETFLQDALRAHPELLVGLDSTGRGSARPPMLSSIGSLPTSAPTSRRQSISCSTLPP